VARLVLRNATSRDIERLQRDGVVGGALPPGETWSARIGSWLAEMQAGRRFVVVAEAGGKLVGVTQLIFKFAGGYEDPEAANGTDTAMIEMIRSTPDAPPDTQTLLVRELQTVAKKRNVRTLTFLVAMDNNKALAQVKGWGFEEFRIMPEGSRLLAFFRKRVA
jgi:hypothetical protein